MGKRNLNKYKNKRQKNTKINKSKDKDEIEIEDEPTTEADIANLTNLESLLSKLQSEDSSVKESITSLLSIHKFNTKDVTLKETIFNESFLRSLVLLLNDNCFQVKYNAVSALINLIMHYNDSEIEAFLLNQTSFINVSVNLLNQFLIIDKKNTLEHVKILKTYHNFLDLLMLIFDLYNEETYQSINFNPIERSLIELVITNKSKVNEDLVNHIHIVLCNIFSVRIENANDNQLIQMYITEAIVVLNGKEANDICRSAMISGLFYLICSNYELFKQKDPAIFQKVIEGIYFGVMNQNNKAEVKALYDMVNGLGKSEENSSITMTDSNTMPSSPEAMIKSKMKELEYRTKSVSILIAAFCDIIENLEIPSNESNNNKIDDNLYEEIDEEEEDKDNIHEDVQVLKETNTPTSFSKLISIALTDLFSSDNYFSLQKMLNQTFITKLLDFFCIEYISDYFINDMDKMLTIKDTIADIEYISFSLINNLIEKVPTLMGTTSFLTDFYALCVSRLKLSNETTNDNDNHNENDESLLSITALSLRNMFNKYKQINTIINLTSIDYAKIFLLISTDSCLVDPFTKMNLIDIISYSFSYSGIGINISLEENMKVCNELKSIFFKETRIEVLSHVVNAYMDIYKEDDIALNKNLRSSDVITLMKSGINAFRDKMKQAKLNEELDKGGYDYVKETLINMKRFVKYKEASFKELNLN